MILRLLVDEGDELYAVDQVSVQAELVDQRVDELWRDERNVGLVVLTEDDLDEIAIAKPEATYLRPSFALARCPPEWLWRGYPARRPTLEFCDPDQEFVPASPNPPKPKHPGRGYDSVTHCGCCRRDKAAFNADSVRDQTPSGWIANGCCPVCGQAIAGMTTRSIQLLYTAYLRS